MDKYAYIIAPISAGLVAQGIKYLISLRRNGFQLEDIVESGGMPSAHAAFMASLLYIVGYREGLYSASFGIMFALTAVVLYDGAGVRRTTGEQTKALKEISIEADIDLPKIHNAKGHTPAELLAGIGTGIVVALILTISLLK
jgi:acid phosphatase family membrane protein YuiD